MFRIALSLIKLSCSQVKSEDSFEKKLTSVFSFHNWQFIICTKKQDIFRLKLGLLIELTLKDLILDLRLNFSPQTPLKTFLFLLSTFLFTKNWHKVKLISFFSSTFFLLIFYGTLCKQQKHCYVVVLFKLEILFLFSFLTSHTFFILRER